MTDKKIFMTDLMISRIPGLKGEEGIMLSAEFRNDRDHRLFNKKDIEYILGRSLGDAAVEDAALESGRRKVSGKKSPINFDTIRKKAEKDIELCQKLGIKICSWFDNDYPPLLREIYDPPLLLFYRGKMMNTESPLLAIVGTRKPSSFAASRAYELSKDMGHAGINVVSGLALGIDAMAHKGNLDAGAATIAVLGSSPDMIYPAANRELARRILETGGIIISEYPPGTGPRKWTFPLRNRIISALSRGVVIIEAPEKSGALITSRYALEQNRDLFVHSCGINSPKGAGTGHLAEEGAKIISSASDILSEWKLSENDLPKQINIYHDKTGTGLASSLADYLNIKV